MRKKIFGLLLFQFYLLFTGHAQVLKGKISTYKGAIYQASVIIKDTTNVESISEFSFAKNGYYSIVLSKNYNKIILEIKANGFISSLVVIHNPIKESTYINNFTLQEDKVVSLKEVSVIGKKVPIIAKEDTTTYNVSSFRNGSERKVEDLLKKLPGIQVNDKSGEIKYKGRSIETVQIEGDNLFGNNYKVGTKNINIDLIDQIQAIENFSENKLLKGIENSNKVVLNLKLKKKSTDISGDINLGNGLDTDKKFKSENSSNILGISQKIKAFANISHNNIGENNSPFDYWDFTHSKQTATNQEQFVSKIIPDNENKSNLDSDRSNVNDLLFGSYNSIFKISRNINIKTNLYYLNDKAIRERNIENSYYADNKYFTNTESFSSEKKINLLQGNFEIKINTSKTSLLEYNFKISDGENITPSMIDFNKVSSYKTILNSEDKYLRNKLLFTKKINENAVLQTELNQSQNDLPQVFSISSGIVKMLDSVDFKTNQSIILKNNFLDFKTKLLGKTQKVKYSFLIGFTHKNLLLHSQLEELPTNQIDKIENSQNEIQYSQKSFFSDNSIILNLDRWKIESGITLTYLSQNLIRYNIIASQSFNKFLILPSINLRFKINPSSLVSSSISYNAKPIVENYLYENKILNNYRNFKISIPSLDLNESYLANVNYTYSNLENQFWANLGTSYALQMGNYLSQNTIDNKLIITTMFYSPEINEHHMIFLSLEKFISKLNIMTKFNTYYSLFKYKNIVNNSNLKENISTNISSDFFTKTAFKGILNFENRVNINVNESKSLNSQTFNSIALNNSFKIIVKPINQVFMLFSADYFIPNLASKNKSYLFFDANLRFSTKNKKVDFFIKFKNLSNNKFFLQIENTDFSQIRWQSNLIHSYGLLSFSYNL